MAKKRNLQPTNPIHPGEMLLEEFLLPAGRSQAAFARDLAAAVDEPADYLRSGRGKSEATRRVAGCRRSKRPVNKAHRDS